MNLEVIMDTTKIADLIKDCDLFQVLNRTEIEKIASLGSVKFYKKGETLFNQDEIGNDLFVIVDGTVFLERIINLGNRKGKAGISLLRKGSALGCWATLLGQTHNLMSSAICQHDSQVVIMNGNSIRELMLDDHELGFKVMQGLCSILRERMQSVYGAMEKI